MSPASIAARLLSLTIAVVVLTSTAALSMFLSHLLGQERNRALEFLQASREQARAGEHPFGEHPEAKRVEETLRTTSGMHLTNFTVQTGTACYSVAMVGPHSQTAAFLFRVDGDERELLQASLQRSCRCSDLDMGPCTLD